MQVRVDRAGGFTDAHSGHADSAIPLAQIHAASGIDKEYAVDGPVGRGSAHVNLKKVEGANLGRVRRNKAPGTDRNDVQLLDVVVRRRAAGGLRSPESDLSREPWQRPRYGIGRHGKVGARAALWRIGGAGRNPQK